MQLRYVFSELRQGLRRNLSMHLAVILTLFVSMTLVGLGILLNQQANKAAEYWGSELQITAQLCKAEDQNPSCTAEVTDAQKAALAKVVEASPEVASYHFETKQEAFDKVRKVYSNQEIFEGPHAVITAEDMPESLWIELKDPNKFEGITSEVIGLPGVSDIRDARDQLKPIYGTIDALKYGALGTAGFLVIAALMLVANTIRLAAFARRREIGIMRLVGASTLYIALPFLMEAIVTAAAGVLLAGGALAAFMKFGIYDRVVGEINFMPWIGWPDFQLAGIAIAILAPVLTVIPTLVLTRKYLKV